MKKIKYSIIIPVYNKQEYLEECISSVINQKFKDFELLLINDGSKDNSLKICQQFEAKDSRIIVIDKLNSGVSDTRNLGIEKAKGEYILFLDADDVWSENLLEIVDKNIVSNEILFFRSCRKRNLLDTETDVFVTALTDIDVILKSVVYNQHLIENCSANFNRVTDYVVSAKLLKEHEIQFNNLLKVGEDKLFNFQLLKHAKNIVYLNQYLYYIRTNDKSVMGSYNIDAFQSNVSLYHAFSNEIAFMNDGFLKDDLNALLNCLGFQIVWNSITSNYCHINNPNSYTHRKKAYTVCKKYLKESAKPQLNNYEKYLFDVFNYPFFFMDLIMKNRIIRGGWYYSWKLLGVKK